MFVEVCTHIILCTPFLFPRPSARREVFRLVSQLSKNMNETKNVMFILFSLSRALRTNTRTLVLSLCTYSKSWAVVHNTCFTHSTIECRSASKHQLSRYFYRCFARSNTYVSRFPFFHLKNVINKESNGSVPLRFWWALNMLFFSSK